MALPVIEAVVTADTRQAEAGFKRVGDSATSMSGKVEAASSRAGMLGGQMARVGKSSGAMRAAIQNASFQLGDFAVMVGGGVDASRALATQLPQLLGPFGVLGAVMSAVVAVAIPLAGAFGTLTTESGQAAQVFGVLTPLVEAMGRAMAAVVPVMVSAAETILNNLDRIIITAGVAATFFAGRYVAAFVAARVATFSLSAALAGLRAALIRTGIGAIIVLAGELIYRFAQLVQAAGGFGAAMGALADVATEVWGRIEKGARAVELGVMAVTANIQAAWLNALALMQDGWAKFVSAVASVALKIPGMEDFGANLAMGAAVAGQGVADMRAEAGRQQEYAGAYGSQAGQLLYSLSAPLESVQKLKDLLQSIKDEKITLPDLLGGGAVGEDGAGGAAQKASPVVDSLKEQAKWLEYVRDQGYATYSALGDFVQQFAGKNKAAAIAAIAIQKGLSMAQIVTNSAAAQMRALAELGPVAGPPMAAKIRAYGRMQAALVAATGIAQAANAGGGGGGMSGGSGGGGGSIIGGRGTSNAATNEPRRFVDIRFSGNVRPSDQQLADQINNLVRDGYVIGGITY